MLEVQSISRQYGDLKAVDDVSFTITSGEIVGLLGHNGAGKTTIMKMLSGYIEPDAGSIYFHNKLIKLDDKDLQRSLGYLPENLPVYPELSIANYMSYAAELKGLKGKQKQQAIRDVIEATNLKDRFLSPISTLSRGMKQRVGVAQAILGKPSLLILDEPTNGLDPAQTEAMRELIKSIAQSATVILSTHIMQEVDAVCDRALIIRKGKLAVDTQLDDLQNTHRILLETTANETSLNEALHTQTWFVSLKPVQSRRSATNSNAFVIETNPEKNTGSTIEECAVRLVEQKVPILSIKPDQQDLQSLFTDNSDSTLQPPMTREVSNVA